MKSYRSERSISNENRFTDIRYEYEDGKHNNVGQGKDKEETLDKVTYVAYKQHFFTSILLTSTPFEKAKLYSSNIVDEEKGDTIFTKQFKANMPLAFNNGELNSKMNWYYGPSDYKLLKNEKQKFNRSRFIG